MILLYRLIFALFSPFGLSFFSSENSIYCFELSFTHFWVPFGPQLAFSSIFGFSPISNFCLTPLPLYSEDHIFFKSIFKLRCLLNFGFLIFLYFFILDYFQLRSFSPPRSTLFLTWLLFLSDVHFLTPTLTFLSIFFNSIIFLPPLSRRKKKDPISSFCLTPLLCLLRCPQLFTSLFFPLLRKWVKGVYKKVQQCWVPIFEEEKINRKVDNAMINNIRMAEVYTVPLSFDNETPGKFLWDQ